MKHGKTVISLGLAVSAMPFMGLPSSWKNVIFVSLGIVIALLVYKMMHYHASVQQSEMEEKGKSEERSVEESEQSQSEIEVSAERVGNFTENEEEYGEQKDESRTVMQGESQEIENDEAIEKNGEGDNEDDDEHTHQNHE